MFIYIRLVTLFMCSLNNGNRNESWGYRKIRSVIDLFVLFVSVYTVALFKGDLIILLENIMHNN